MRELKYIKQSEFLNGDCKQILPQYHERQVDLVFTSPPYFNQKECATGGSTAEGYKTVEEYFEDMELIYRMCKALLKEGGIFAMNIGSDATIDLTAFTSVMLHKIGLRFIDKIAWIRGTGNITRGFHVTASNRYFPFLVWEPVYIYKKVLPNVEGLRNQPDDDFPQFEERFKGMITSFRRTNVWEIPQDSNVDHPAPYPIKLAHDIIACYTPAGGIILDPFAGSGSTAIAANQVGDRKYLCIELLKDRYEYALQRIDDNSQLSLL